MQDLEDMLGFRPHKIYFYLWKYVSPLCLIVLISATVIEMAISPPGYSAWVQELVSVWPCVWDSKKVFGLMVDLYILCLQAQERFQSYPPWALAMCFALIIVAMLPLPIVFIARRFNLISDGSNKLSVSYRKSMMKDVSNLEEQDESRFILGSKPGEAPLSVPSRKGFLTPGRSKALDPSSLSPNICYGASYQNDAISPTTPTTPMSATTPESDS